VCILQRGRWCDITVLNAHAQTQKKRDGAKHGFYEEVECIFDQFPKYRMNILLDFNGRVRRDILS
jgi:hypothetical protein